MTTSAVFAPPPARDAGGEPRPRLQAGIHRHVRVAGPEIEPVVGDARHIVACRDLGQPEVARKTGLGDDDRLEPDGHGGEQVLLAAQGESGLAVGQRFLEQVQDDVR